MHEEPRDCTGYTFEIHGRIGCKGAKGAFDYITKQPTNASRRYRRWLIRRAEKERRNKLKYGEE